ncbi:DUF2510 domain-containing protein [Nocardia brasiliensis]|uniref:DUF2510 domain-containing protein n=1 Tax=Nocardia brasiliensis TaxID=37326 RepID=UPI003D7A9EFE
MAWTVIIAVAVVFLVSQTTDAFAGIGNGAATAIAVGAALLVLLVRALIRVGDKRPPPVVIAQPAAPPPGWYPDSRQTGLLRWFDGHVWTDHTQRPPTV